MTELQEVADYICQQERIDHIEIQVHIVRTGRARIRKRKITIPQWAVNDGVEYAYSYVIHEICHYLALGHLHDSYFKSIEKKWLNRFGLCPVYARAYAKALYSPRGQLLWSYK